MAVRYSDDPTWKALDAATTTAAMGGDRATALMMAKKRGEREQELDGLSKRLDDYNSGFTSLTDLFNPKRTPVSQEELAEIAERALAPGGRAALSDTGQGAAPVQFPGRQQSTFRQLSSLDPEEKNNLDTYLVNKHNLDYKTFEERAKKQFLGGGFAAPSRLLGYGI
jgi:hypothetical protein